MKYPGVTPAWAEDVASHLDRFAGDRVPLIDDLWVSRTERLSVRYRLGADRLAARFRLDWDPTSGQDPDDSERLASNLLHSLHSPADIEWIDGQGYGWWGDEPDGGWDAVHAEERAVTIR